MTTNDSTEANFLTARTENARMVTQCNGMEESTMTALPIVPDSQEIRDAAESLSLSIDTLLDKLAYRVLGTPCAGTVEWRRRWEQRDTADGRAAVERHRLARIAIARAAGLEPASELGSSSAAGLPSGRLASHASGDRSRRLGG